MTVGGDMTSQTSKPTLQLVTDTFEEKTSVSADGRVIAWDFDALYNRFSPYVASIAVRITGRDGDVEDIVHDVFVAMLRHQHRIGSLAEMRGWLGKCTVRSAGKVLRRRRLRRRLGLEPAPSPSRVVGQGGRQDVDGNLAVIAPGATPEDRAMLGQMLHRLDDLSPKLRIPWCLRHLGGESLGDIAQQTGTSLATVKRRLLEAQRALEADANATMKLSDNHRRQAQETKRGANIRPKTRANNATKRDRKRGNA